MGCQGWLVEKGQKPCQSFWGGVKPVEPFAAGIKLEKGHHSSTVLGV